jgi:ribosomal protein S18 acetylase RimI-like enzyme
MATPLHPLPPGSRLVRIGGELLLVRPIEPRDKRLLADGLARLSPRSVQQRFLVPKPRLSRAELRYLTEVDGMDHYALVATRADDLAELVAVARWVRLAGDPETADVAIVVGDCHQGRGIGRALARMLAEAARERGVRRVTATMEGDNLPAQRLLRSIAARLQPAPARLGSQTVVAEVAA